MVGGGTAASVRGGSCWNGPHGGGGQKLLPQYGSLWKHGCQNLRFVWWIFFLTHTPTFLSGDSVVKYRPPRKTWRSSHCEIFNIRILDETHFQDGLLFPVGSLKKGSISLNQRLTFLLLFWGVSQLKYFWDIFLPHLEGRGTRQALNFHHKTRGSGPLKLRELMGKLKPPKCTGDNYFRSVHGTRPVSCVLFASLYCFCFHGQA